MKIFAAMVVKNEDDIIKSTILSALAWADTIIIMDNNSTDNTREIIENLAIKHDQIIYWGLYQGPFKDSLRSIIYDDYRHLSSIGDWWCRLDGDEIYIDNPRDFILNLSFKDDHIYSAHFEFVFTTEDLIAEQKNPELKKQSVFDRLTYYKTGGSEVRFVKIKKDTIWPLRTDYPLYLLKSPDLRIRVKHYQYRTIEQMKIREATRMPKEGTREFKPHWGKHLIQDAQNYTYNDGFYLYDENKLRRRSKRRLSKQIKMRIFRFLMQFSTIRNNTGI